MTYWASIVKEPPDTILSVTDKMKIQIKRCKGNNYKFVNSDLQKESQKELVTFGESNFATLVYYFHDYMIFCFSVLSFSRQTTDHQFNVFKFQNYVN